jgi:hypothetical protein
MHVTSSNFFGFVMLMLVTFIVMCAFEVFFDLPITSGSFNFVVHKNMKSLVMIQYIVKNKMLKNYEK